MPSRLQPLGYDGIGAMARQPVRFRYRGGAGKDACPRGFHPGQQLGRRQTEVKADHRGSELAKQGGVIRIEGGTAGRRRLGSGIQPELGIVGSQRLSPALLFGRIRLTLSMTEEVDIEGARSTGRQLFQCLCAARPC